MSGASRTKGRGGERELRGVLEAAGWGVHAGQRNLAGACDMRAERTPDPYSGEVPERRLWVECKRAERLRLPEWIAQAASDAAPGTTPVVVYRQNRGEWRADLSLDDLLALIG